MDYFKIMVCKEIKKYLYKKCCIYITMCYNKDVNDIEKIYFSIMVKQKRDYEVKKELLALFLFAK